MSCGLSETGEVSEKAGSQKGAGATSCRAIHAVVRGLDFGLIAIEKQWENFQQVLT